MDHQRIGSALRRMREQRELSLRDIEEAIGTAFTTIGMRERGKLRWDDDDIDSYLKAIGATRKDLEHALAELPVSRKISATIPLIPTLASAGRYWVDRGDAHEYPDGTRQIPRGVHTTHPQAFAVPVEGESMEPFFKAGDDLSKSNLRTGLERILKAAGIPPWPRIFHNLRASCQTDLEAKFPTHVVCAWLGNSPQTAAKHYLQVRQADFDKAASTPT